MIIMTNEHNIENQNIIKYLKRRYIEVKNQKSIGAVKIFHAVLNQYMREPLPENRSLNDTVKILRGKCNDLLNRNNSRTRSYYKRSA